MLRLHSTSYEIKHPENIIFIAHLILQIHFQNINYKQKMSLKSGAKTGMGSHRGSNHFYKKV